MNEIQAELIEKSLKARQTWQLWRSKLRMFELWRPDVTWDDVKEAQLHYDEAELAHQKARKAAGLPYYYVGCENE